MDSCILSSEDVIYLLEQKFGDTSKIKLIDYNIKPLSDKIEGFMGIHLRLKCQLYPNECVCFFIKKQLDLKNQENNELAESLQSPYNREELFYEILDENYKKYNVNFAPRHYKFEKDKTLLILDDIGVDGFMLGKKSLLSSSGFDLNHCKVGLKALARLHTFSINLEKEKGKTKPNYKFTDDVSHLSEEMLISLSHKFPIAQAYTRISIHCLKLAFEYLPNITSEEISNLKDLFQKEMDDFIYKQLKPSTKFKNVLCHGDLWHKNIMFKYSGDTPIDCNFVDFQVFRYLPGSHDVLFFLYLNTSSEFRQKNLHQLMEYYYEEFYTELKKIGINLCEIFSLTDFYESCANFFTFSKIIAAFYLQLLLLGDEFLEKTCNSDSKTDLRLDMLFGNREKYLLSAYKENYRPYLDRYMPIVDEVKDVLLNRKIMRDDCFDIIRRKISSNNYVLEKYEILPNRSKNLLKIKISFNGIITKFNFFMKCLDGDSNRKETFIYQILSLNKLLSNTDVMNLTDQVIPKCYYSVNARSIVLENLENIGFKHVQTLDYKATDAVIKTLAKFHAAYLILEYKSQTENVHKFYKFSDITSELMKENACDKSKENLINQLQSSTYKKVLCHGNLTLENIMFKGEDRSECRFVDFKQSRLLPPSYDILTFLYMSTSQSFREQYLNQIIDSYYDYLTVELGRSKIIVTDILKFVDFKNSLDEIKSILEQSLSLNNLSIK